MITKHNQGADDSTFDADSKIKLEKAHKAIDRPDQFATLFVNAAKTQKNIAETIKEILREILTSDVKGRETLKALVREVENENWRGFLKTTWGKVAIALWTVIVIVVTAFINHRLFG